MARLLDRLQAANMSDRGIQTWAQRVCEQIEAQFVLIQEQIEDISDLLAQVVAAQAAAAAAQATANTAQTTADTVTKNDAITASYTAPGTVLTAADAGSNATITIAAHTRVYGDAAKPSVNGGSVTGLNYSTVYFVYYDQVSRAGGAVTYQATTNANTALPNATQGRHYVGKITTPAAAAPPTSGGSSAPAGGGGVQEADIGSTL